MGMRKRVRKVRRIRRVSIVLDGTPDEIAQLEYKHPVQLPWNGTQEIPAVPRMEAKQLEWTGDDSGIIDLEDDGGA